MKQNGSEIFFASKRKKCFFRLFRNDAKRRNLKRNENGTKRKQNEKRSEKLLSFSLRSEMKQNRSEKMSLFSLRSEMEEKFFRFDAKKVFFSLVLASEAKGNEIKRKQSEKTFISFRIEAKRKDRKRNEKILEAKQSENTLY